MNAIRTVGARAPQIPVGQVTPPPVRLVQPPKREVSSAGTPRARLTRFVQTATSRVSSAAVKGLVIAALVGATFGCAPKSEVTTPASKVPVAMQVAAAQTELAFPKDAKEKLVESLAAAKPHATHLWRDEAPYSGRLLNGYVEIARGDQTKWEYSIADDARVVDRQIHESLGGYPVNYGFVPQTFAFDGDPFDVLVLGPALDGGTWVKGEIVGVMHMDDEKGRDPKVVISPLGEDGKPLYALTAAEKARIGGWFDIYKKPDAHKGKWSKVTGWGDAAEARALVDRVHDFFHSERSGAEMAKERSAW